MSAHEPGEMMREGQRDGSRRSATRMRARTKLALSGLLAAAALLQVTPAASADPAVSVDLEDVATTRWDGAVASASLGEGAFQAGDFPGASSAGDVNGDGLDDLAVASGAAGDKGVYVLFSSPNGKGARSIGTLQSSDGYKIQFDPTLSPNAIAFANVGDQNGDGIPDLMIRTTPTDTFFGFIRTFIVYGVPDPTTLPLCAGSAVTRCLDLGSLTDDQGYVLRGSGTFISSPELAIGGRGVNTAGDFDGDGVQDFMFLGGTFGAETAYLVRGGERTGTTVIETMPADEMLRFDGVAGSTFGTSVTPVGDVNGDGFDDVFVGAFNAGGGYALYGHELTSSPFDMSTFTADDGLAVAAPVLQGVGVANLGDLNGDGRPDLGASILEGIGDDSSWLVSVLYGPEQPTPDPLITGDDLVPGTGYVINNGGEAAFLGSGGGFLQKIDDLNNDGVPDMIAGGPQTGVEGASAAGAAYVLFGQNPAPSEQLGVGPELIPDLGVAMVGSAAGDRAGSSVATIGDLDGDGLADVAVGAHNADHNGLSNSGSVYIVPGRALIAQAQTGAATGITDTGASLAGVATSNKRDIEVSFEYGTSEEYGQMTPVEEIEGSGQSVGVQAELGGLSAETTYHYRIAVTNELGVTRYGDDRTFTTGDAVVGDPCQANPAAPGCPQYDYCQANPDVAVCQPARARLSALIATPKRLAIRRGGSGRVGLILTNVGNGPARVRVCAQAPRRFLAIRGGRCRTLRLPAGATRTPSFRVRVKRSARRGRRLVLRFRSTGQGLAARRAKARVIVG
jgi:hypothetical protein